MNNLRLTFFIIIWGTLGLTGNAAATTKGGEPDITIRVRSVSTVSGGSILLEDIADITCRTSCPDTLADLRIGIAPAPGKNKNVSPRIIESRLRSWKRKYNGTVDLTVPDRVSVETSFQIIPEATLQKLFYSYVAEKSGGREFRITDIRIKGNKPLPAGDIGITPDDTAFRFNRGRVATAFSIRDCNGSNSKVYISSRLDLFEEVVVAEHEIPKGETISAKDLGLRTLSTTGNPADYVTDLREAVGKVATVRIPPLTPVQKKMLTSPSLVKKGDIVKLIATSGSLTVTTVGISKGDGGLGDQVPVENTTSGKVIIGRVLTRDTVEVLF